MNIRTINIDGQVIQVAIREGSSVPVLFFNGIGASLELVLPFIDSLPPELSVIAFDVPGIGGSSLPTTGAYTMQSLAQTVSKMLDVLGVQYVDALGLSWGGFLAQQFAYSFPTRCRKLILAATSHGVLSVPPSFKVLGLMSSPKRYTDLEFAARITPDIYGGSFRYDKQLGLSHARKMIADKTPTFEQGYKYQMGALFGWSSLTWLHTLRQPTLVLCGNDDPIIPLVNMHVLSNLIPNSVQHVFNDGHLFLLTDIERCTPIIHSFLEAV